MDKNPSHWRKAWPEGNIDPGSGTDEFDIVDRFNRPAAHKPPHAYVWPTWNEYEPHTMSMNDVNQGTWH